MQRKILYKENNLQWIVWGRDPGKPEKVIDTNEYLIVCENQGILLDPGGTEIFPTVLNEVSKVIDVKNIKAYLCSHQDPDVMSSLPLWMALTPEAKIHLSWIWSGFVAHFGHKYANSFNLVPDEGQTIRLGNHQFQLVPAHFCHSPGNFNLFDPVSKILFSGDVGASIVPLDYPFFVENFDDHIKHMESFHVRWMPSNEAKNRWIRRIRRLNPELLCPQHGALFKGKMVHQFLDWFENLDVGRSNE